MWLNNPIPTDPNLRNKNLLETKAYYLIGTKVSDIQFTWRKLSYLRTMLLSSNTYVEGTYSSDGD